MVSARPQDDDGFIGPSTPLRPLAPPAWLDLQKRYGVARLALGILSDAVILAVEHRNRRDGHEARDWFRETNGASNGLFSFEGCCQILKFDNVPELRTAILALKPGALARRKSSFHGRHPEIGGGHNWKD